MSGLRAGKTFDAKLDELAEAVRERNLILFVGGGVSQSLGLPDFRQLVAHLASAMGWDPGHIALGDYPVVAEAYLATQGHLGSLRSWMDTTWHPTTIDIRKSEIHNLIVDLDFPTIYTTNYDRWLERAFEARGKPFRKVANVVDLTRQRGVRTEIIKFHGDFEDDESLVLTETSYFRRMTFESPLDIRLRADCLARPVLFLGYSLHDLNTRYLLFRLQELWQTTSLTAARPISYIFMLEPDPAQEIVLRSRGVEPISCHAATPEKAAVDFLSRLRERSGARSERKSEKKVSAPKKIKPTASRSAKPSSSRRTRNS